MYHIQTVIWNNFLSSHPFLIENWYTPVGFIPRGTVEVHDEDDEIWREKEEVGFDEPMSVKTEDCFSLINHQGETEKEMENIQNTLKYDLELLASPSEQIFDVSLRWWKVHLLPHN